MTDAERIQALEADLATLRQQQAETQQALEFQRARADKWVAVCEKRSLELETAQTQLAETQQARDELRAELRAVDQVLARRPAIATEPSRCSAIEKACFVAQQQSDRAHRLEVALAALQQAITALVTHCRQRAASPTQIGARAYEYCADHLVALLAASEPTETKTP